MKGIPLALIAFAFVSLVSPAGKTAPIAPSGKLNASILLEHPTDSSIGYSVTFLQSADFLFKYGESAENLDGATVRRHAEAGQVLRGMISGLLPGRSYVYRLEWFPEGGASQKSATGRFSTRKASGTPFTFVLEADPHLDENSSGQGYARTLELMAADRPDFAIDLGDTSMAEKLANDRESALYRNQLIRSYWDNLDTPWFMVQGNHDGEHGWPSNPGKPTSAEMAALRRAWLIDSPTWFSWEWGDALFVVLDPYAAEPGKPVTGEAWTLGAEQLDWLTRTLERSRAKFKFVFIHNLVGGKGKEARGGADLAGNFEWGKIHALLRSTGVQVVFHGHDHFYAEEAKDGIIYQLVPQPSAAKPHKLAVGALAEYGYSQGVFLPSPGYLRIGVSAEKATIEFVGSPDGKVLRSYDLPGR